MYKDFWQETVNQIKTETGDQIYSLWFKNIEYESSDDSVINLSVPSSFYKDQIINRYKTYIETKFFDISGHKISLSFSVKNRDPVPYESSKAETAEPQPSAPKKAPVIAAAGALSKDKKNNPSLLPEYTFDTYVHSTNNEFAYNAALAIAKNPGKTNYNPCLFYGGVGLGKTHLIQAIGNKIHETTDLKVLYISAENFTNEFLQALKDNRMSSFKNKYRYNIDVLLIDDIHFFQKKDGTQEELFFTFNELYNAKKQMVFTCDRPISELKNITDRLQSRFSSGSNIDLLPPNYETRCAILQKKMESQNISLPTEVIEFIAGNISSNVRDLEAALKKMLNYSELINKTVTIDIAKQQLKDSIYLTKKDFVSIDMIIRCVANHYHLSPADIKGKKKTKNITLPRQMAMYIARDITEMSLTEIGEEFNGKDHTTVMYACEKIETQIKADPTMDSTIQQLIREIKSSLTTG